MSCLIEMFIDGSKKISVLEDRLGCDGVNFIVLISAEEIWSQIEICGLLWGCWLLSIWLTAYEEIRDDFKGANQILQEKNDFHAHRECVTIGREKFLQIVYNN